MKKIESLMVKHCAPTLLGMKAGSMVAVCTRELSCFKRQLLAIQKVLWEKQMEMMVIPSKNNKALIYLYCENKLKQSLDQPLAQHILCQNNYQMGNVSFLVEQLRRRMVTQAEFPHEIGLFLGYPPEDVQGFIRHKGLHYKMLGHWKVYENVEQAKRIFEKYRLCEKHCEECIKKNISFSLLVKQFTLYANQEEDRLKGA